MRKEAQRLAISLAIATPVIIGYLYWRRYKKSSPSKKVSDEKPPETKFKNKFEQALEYKKKGNESFKTADYENAIKYYTLAIDVCSEDKKDDLATFYNNRAAAYFHEKKYKETIDDCTSAIKLKKAYTKPIFRRALAHECMGDFRAGYEDFTCVCFLERFSNIESIESADRLLKKLVKQEAIEHLKTKKFLFPANKYVLSFLRSYQWDPFFNPDLRLQFTSNEDDLHNKESKPLFDNLVTHVNNDKYEDAFNLLKAYFSKHPITANGDKDKSIKSHDILNILVYSTFCLIMGDLSTAKTGFDTLEKWVQTIETVKETNASGDTANLLYNFSESSKKLLSDKKFQSNLLIKLASVDSQEMNMQNGLKYFEMALAKDTENCDIYYHRGQLKLLIGDYESAVIDFNEAMRLYELYSTTSSFQSDYASNQAPPTHLDEETYDILLEFPGKLFALARIQREYTKFKSYLIHAVPNSKLPSSTMDIIPTDKPLNGNGSAIDQTNLATIAMLNNLSSNQQQKLKEDAKKLLQCTLVKSLTLCFNRCLLRIDKNEEGNSYLKESDTTFIEDTDSTVIESTENSQQSTKLNSPTKTNLTNGYHSVVRKNYDLEPFELDTKTREFYVEELKKLASQKDCQVDALVEGYVYLSQAYTDIMEFDCAERYLKFALRIDPQNFSIYVHLALLQLQKIQNNFMALQHNEYTNEQFTNGIVGQNIPLAMDPTHLEKQASVAIEYLFKSLAIEPKCEFAYETLGTIYMQSGKMEEAMTSFDNAIKYAKSEFELAHLFSMKETVLAQKNTLLQFGIADFKLP